MRLIAELLAVVALIGIWLLFVWGVSFLIVLITGYDFGFLNTLGCLGVLLLVCELLFVVLKVSTK